MNAFYVWIELVFFCSERKVIYWIINVHNIFEIKFKSLENCHVRTCFGWFTIRLFGITLPNEVYCRLTFSSPTKNLCRQFNFYKFLK